MSSAFAFFTQPLHWLVATVVTLIAGIPVIYLAAHRGARDGLRDFTSRLDKSDTIMHEARGGTDREFVEVWKFSRAIKADTDRTVKGLAADVDRLTVRVAMLEGKGQG